MAKTDPKKAQLEDRFNNPGILARVPGALIAETSRGLPSPDKAKLDSQVIADATLLDGTPVRLQFVVVEHKHRRSTLRWWSCVRAEEVG